MEVTENTELKLRILNSIKGAVSGDREGIHLSDTIYCLRKAYWRKLGLNPEPTEQQIMLWVSGYAFQAYMFPLEDEIPQLLDGIHCTPDIQSGIEVKSTRQSSGKFDLLSNKAWIRQILGYCKVLDKTEYDLAVLFICGDYRPPFPTLGCFHITATQDEIDTNWLRSLIQAERLRKSLERGIPPDESICDTEPWEWEYCENIELCEGTACWGKLQLRKSKRGRK